MTVCGAVPKGTALMRSGARVGDWIYVSGKLGGSAFGLATGKGRAWKRHLRPEPRLALGQFLRKRLHATAAMDLSDGLSLDLNRMCVASKVSAAIDAPPRFPGASLEQALHGGEDYELLFTLRPGSRPPAEFEGLPLTRIGAITKRGAAVVLLDGEPLAPLGFDHFRKHMTAPDPSPVVDLLYAFRGSKVMFTAVRMGVFDRLERGAASLDALAAELNANADALERLLDACVGLGLLERDDDARYANTALASAYLCRSAPGTLAGYVLFSDQALYPMWGHLEDAVREGGNRWRQTFQMEGNMFEHFFRDAESMRAFLLGLHGYGVISSPRVAAAFDLSRFKKLVDLGGGSGHFAIAACERYPNLRAAVFELPRVIEFAREMVQRSPAADRIEMIAGDFFTEALPEADLYSVGQILHDWSEDKIERLLDKISLRLLDWRRAAHCREAARSR